MERLICSEALLFAKRQVALGRKHERVQVNRGKIRWRNARTIGSEQINLRATFDHRAQHFLHVDRTTLAAKDRNPWIGGDISDAHHFGLAAVSAERRAPALRGSRSLGSASLLSDAASSLVNCSGIIAQSWSSALRPASLGSRSCSNSRFRRTPKLFCRSNRSSMTLRARVANLRRSTASENTRWSDLPSASVP